MPIRIQDKPSGLYVAEGLGFTTERDEAATFQNVDEATRFRNATMRAQGNMERHWDLRVVMGPDTEE